MVIFIDNVCEQLDRIFYCLTWRLKFPQAKIYHHPAFYFDHSPIELNLFSASLIGWQLFYFLKA